MTLIPKESQNPDSTGKTVRGERIREIMEQSMLGKTPTAKLRQPTGEDMDPDQMIRQLLSDMVLRLLKEGHHDLLEKLLHEYREFIGDILKMLQEERTKG